ncbi:MAG: glycosyltransferase family 4 protein [Herminiimonas sp.]|nr:glycosyltransferase family 4 protein [Herminiimonas sp.]
MRLLYDLFPCQTGSRLRGIGRFTLSLAQAMARQRGKHEMIALANGLDLYRGTTDHLRSALGDLLQPAPVMSYTYVERGGLACDRVIHESVATVLINRAYTVLTPDVVLYSTPFEGWGEEGVGAVPAAGDTATLQVAVLYDFIPWLFPQQYLDDVPGYRDWYAMRLAALQRFDLLLAISEATRNDAIRILGMSPDQVVNISGAASPMFTPPPADAPLVSLTKFGIHRPFVLYTGNVDFRKNQAGMLRAYALLPEVLRSQHQLVLTQVLERDSFFSDVRASGLDADDVVVTGHITDEEMIALYTRCALFVFPSLYEGFGLPILEAMACGAAVIAGDNSSIPEIVGRADMLFDASDPAAIAAAMQAVLDNDGLRRELQAYGIERAKVFTWERSAARAWSAIETAASAKQRRRSQLARAALVRQRIALICASPSTHCAAARHVVRVLPLLAEEFDIDLYVEEGVWTDAPSIEARFPIYPHTRLAAQRGRYAALVYQFDNTPEHAFMLPLTEAHPGIVVLHDWRIDRLVETWALHAGTPDLAMRELMYCHGLQALLDQLRNGTRYPMNRHLVETSRFLLVSQHAGDAAWPTLQDSGGGWRPPVLALGEEPQAAIEAYRAAIESSGADDTIQTADALAPLLEQMASPELALQPLADHVVNNQRLQQQPRLLFDVTHLSRSDGRSGIQRVVRNIARAIGGFADFDRPLELVVQSEGRLWRATRTIASIFEIDQSLVPPGEILPQPGDTLLMIDSSWEQYAAFEPVFQSTRQLGGTIVTVVYDLIPLQHPQFCVPALVVAFETWFRLAVAHSHMLLCISEAVAAEVRNYLTEHQLDPHRRMAIRSWPLGADLAVSRHERTVRPAVLALSHQRQREQPQGGIDTDSPLFLMVGTVEPRKGHDFVLDAFDLLWSQGSGARLCIAGAIGWKTDSTIARIRSHPQLQKKLFFIEQFTDAEINLCYRAATALIAASVAEGFGLPIVEAALHQVPSLACDIPVFREVGGQGALYFSLAAPTCLAQAVRNISTLGPSQRIALAAQVRTVTWDQSARRLLEVIGVSS